MKINTLDDLPESWIALYAICEYGHKSASQFHQAAKITKQQKNVFDSERWEALAEARKVYTHELVNRLEFIGLPPRSDKDFTFNNSEKKPNFIVNFKPETADGELFEDYCRSDLQCWEAIRRLQANADFDPKTHDLIYGMGLHIEASISLLINWSASFDRRPAV